jgi:hypothetical protein
MRLLPAHSLEPSCATYERRERSERPAGAERGDGPPRATAIGGSGGPSPGPNWSGRRGSNPRPTAWKAVTLPLSYSRLRAARCAFRHYGGQARISSFHHLRPLTSDNYPTCIRFTSAPVRRLVKLACQPEPVHARRAKRAKAGGEGRIRTFEATGATDLQSVAFDRFATSPNRRQTCRGSRCSTSLVCLSGLRRS